MRCESKDVVDSVCADFSSDLGVTHGSAWRIDPHWIGKTAILEEWDQVEDGRV